MTARDWKLLGWVWVAGLTILGIGILAAPELHAVAADWIRPGQGTALLLVAASILFAAVFPNLWASGNRLVAVASVLTAIFGYAGTMIILSNENPVLLAIVVLYTYYLALMSYALLPVFWLVRYLHTHFR